MCNYVIAELNVENLNSEETECIQVNEGETVTVNITDDENVVKEVKIGADLNPQEKEEMIKLLKDYVDVFAWSYADMPGLCDQCTYAAFTQTLSKKKGNHHRVLS